MSVQIKRYSNGKIRYRKIFVNGVLHSEKLPAEIHYYFGGRVHSKTWYLNGEIGRTKGPSRCIYTRRKTVKLWIVNNELHREDGPAYLEYNKDYRIEKWYKHGLLHRKWHPAVVKIGNELEEKSYLYGELHNTNGYAYKYVSAYREIMAWYRNNLYFRENGPHITEIYDNSYIQRYIIYETDSEIYYKRLITKENKSISIESYILLKKNQKNVKNKKNRIQNCNNVYGCIIDTIDNSIIYIKQKISREKIYHSLHREDGPAHTVINERGVILLQIWSINGEFHREGKPAHVEYTSDNKIIKEIWYQNGKIHREDNPALFSYYTNGSIKSYKWYNNNLIHNANGPSNVSYDINGNIEIINYKIIHNGKSVLHRCDGPAKSIYKNGDIVSLAWHLYGDPHRTDGPAKVFYNLRYNYIYQEIWIENDITIRDKIYNKECILSDYIVINNSCLVELIYNSSDNDDLDEYDNCGYGLCEKRIQSIYYELRSRPCKRKNLIDEFIKLVNENMILDLWNIVIDYIIV